MYRFLLLTGLLLAAAPLSAEAPDPTALLPGSLELELDSSARSSLAIDEDGLDDALCGPLEPPDLPQNGGSEDCRLLIGGQLAPICGFDLGAPEATGDGSARVMAEVSRFEAQGLEPFTSRCGDWTWTLKLHASAPPRPLPFHFLPPVAGEPTALFVGSLAFTVEVTFTPADGGAAKVFPWPFELDLAGRWTALPADALEDGQTNLALLVGYDPVSQSFVGQPAGAHGPRYCDWLRVRAKVQTLVLVNLHLP